MMANVVNVTVPKGWAELSQQQLRTLLSVIVSVNSANNNVAYESREDYAIQTAAQVQTRCFFKWTGMTVICPYGTGYLVRYGDMELMMTAELVTLAISHLSWITQTPPQPVRLDTVDGAHAIPADLSSGLTFDAWLACETLWQRYQISPDDALLRQMAGILYGKEDIKPNEAETLGIFYWWAGVKNLMSDLFPHFFRKIGGDNESEPPTYDEIRRNIDTQIRALTKGDITKEREVLSLDAMRALTELDAQAYEYEELRKKYPAKQ